MLCSQASAQKVEPKTVSAPAVALAQEMAQRLSKELHTKTVVGEPVKAGAVTLIPILLIDVNFGGGNIAVPSAGGGDAFYMNGEARPLGFVVISKSGMRFLNVGKRPAQ